MFKSCKRKYKYKYVDRVPNPVAATPNKYLSFGQSIHKSLAKYNMIEDEKLRTLHILHNLLRSVWIREGYENRDEERDFGLKGLKILTDYFYNPLDKSKEVLLVERMIKKDMGDFILCGVLDKGFKSLRDTLEVTDYKTGDKIDQPDEFTIDLQLPIYTILAKEVLGDYPSIVSYYYLSQHKKIERKITNSNIDKIVETLWDIYEEIINEKDFPCSPNSYCSMSCDYSNICEGANDNSQQIKDDLEKLKEMDFSSIIF